MSLKERLWLYEFHWRLRQSGGLVPTRSEILMQTERYRRIKMPGTDPQSRFNRHMAACLLAATELLERDFGLTRMETVQETRAPFVDTGAWISRIAIHLWLAVERNPFAGLLRRGVAPLAGKLWGNGLEMEDRVQNGRLTMEVRQCPFMEFFWNASRPDLMQTICDWDEAWMKQVNVKQAGLRVSRPYLLATGNKCCAFVFEQAPFRCAARRSKFAAPRSEKQT